MNKYIETYKEIGRRYRRYIIFIGILFAVIFLAYIKGTYFDNFDSAVAPKPLLNWTLTPWQMNGKGGWEGIAPAILVEGRKPFSADHPQAYIDRLQEMHDDPAIVRGQFYSKIGELRDGLERAWEAKVEVKP